MRELERHYERLNDVLLELIAIDIGKTPETTIIDGEEFDNEAWLEAEEDALKDECVRMAQTVRPDGTFAGLKESGPNA